jgi:RNA polymerase sigma-70 factor (ECF subfamily)
MEPQDTRNDSFMKLYEPHHASALAYARRLTGNGNNASDLLHDSLEAALRALNSLRNEENFKPWFFRIILNRHLNSLRKDKASKRSVTETAPEAPIEVDTLVTERAKLLDALSVLAPEEREALILFEVEGFELRDIARIQKRNVPAVKYSLKKARRKLRIAYFSDTPPPSTPEASHYERGD